MHSTSFLLRAAVLLLPVAGCVLVVPTIEHDAHCAVTGSSPCATCIAKSCQGAIDNCCNEAACSGPEGHSPVLDALDACAGGNRTGCVSGLSEAQTTTAVAIRGCVTTSCKTECLGTAAVAVKWTCTTPRTDDNACATCIYKECATPLDGCCDDSSCSKDTNLQTDLSACVGGDAAACFYEKKDWSLQGKEGVVRACVDTKCSPVCFGDRRAHQTCDLYAGGAYCQCYDSVKSSGPDCTKSIATGATCVQGQKGCTCGTYSCSSPTVSSGCSCSFRSEDAGGTSCGPSSGSSGSSGGDCCIKVDDRGVTCECKKYSSCYSDESRTESCDLEVVEPLLRPNIIVDTCSN